MTEPLVVMNATEYCDIAKSGAGPWKAVLPTTPAQGYEYCDIRRVVREEVRSGGVERR